MINRSLSQAADIEQLMRKAQTGEPLAIAGLLEHWYPDLRRYAQRHCHASYAEDAVQETLLVVTRRFSALRQLSSATAWMFTILKRQCYAMFRQFHIDFHVEDEAWAAMIDAKPAAELRLDLIAALESLPHHYLQVILLRDFEDLTITEMSEQLKESVATVKSRLHRARQMVREYLAVEG